MSKLSGEEQEVSFVHFWDDWADVTREGIRWGVEELGCSMHLRVVSNILTGRKNTVAVGVYTVETITLV